MAYKAAKKAASKIASKSQQRKMESITATIADAWFPRYHPKECQHCGARGSKTELLCDCEAMIARFGAAGCGCCGIFYGTIESVQEYIVAWGGVETFDRYSSDMAYWMPTPCFHCSKKYIAEYMLKHAAFEEWKETEGWRYDEWEPYWDDEPCRGGSGPPCPCCGD